MADLIEIEELTKRFGPFTAVDRVTLNVARGDVLGFLGPNGAGKSTTMKMVAGFLPPTAGTARIHGVDVIERPVEAKRLLGYLPEGAPSYGDMTALGFLEFVAEIRGLSGRKKKDALDRVIDLVTLEGVLGQRVETLSKGYKRRVGLAQALVHDPDVLIMDEPTDGLDPNQKHQVRELIRGMAQDKAVIISTHILEEVEAVCNRAAVIAAGRILADGTPDDLLARSPLHNAVRVQIAATDAERASADLSHLGSVGGVETLETANGTALLRVLPRDNASIAVDVGALLHDKGYQVRSLSTERGALDEVFREITVGAGEREVSHA